MHDFLVEARAAAQNLADAIDCLDEQIQDGTAPLLAQDVLAEVKQAYRRVRETKRIIPTRQQLAALMENYDR